MQCSIYGSTRRTVCPLRPSYDPGVASGQSCKCFRYTVKMSVDGRIFSCEFSVVYRNRGPHGFIVPSMYACKRTRNRFRYNMENSPQNIRGYTDIFTVYAASTKLTTATAIIDPDRPRHITRSDHRPCRHIRLERGTVRVSPGLRRNDMLAFDGSSTGAYRANAASPQPTQQLSHISAERRQVAPPGERFWNGNGFDAGHTR